MPIAIKYETGSGRCPIDEWLTDRIDREVRNKVLGKVTLMEAGNFNNCKPIGGGVHERTFSGKGRGLRLYFAMDGPEVIVLLCAGDKRSQVDDIGRASQFWAEYRSRQRGRQ